MNFLAHAVLAARFQDDKRFVLGSVLPDLATMAGVPWKSARDPAIRDGIELHKICDDLFHGEDAFRLLLAQSRGELARRGLSRAPTLAATHVGVELFIDGQLSFDESARATLRHSLLAAQNPTDLGWDESELARWHAFCERLADDALVCGYRDHAFVGERLCAILGRRKRLRVPENEVPVLLEYLPRLRDETWDRAPGLLERLEQRLKTF